MLGGFVQISLILAGPAIVEPAIKTTNPVNIDASFFEGRWAFEEDTCEMPTNWTMIAGGNFVSEDLVGTWDWSEGRLTLNLTDLAIDEETGESGGKFQMDGPVEIVASNLFKMTVEPDIYSMKRCPN
ncbi:MAG: hypothetical protein Pars2KO_20610 [Parasphingorhabdus sp.]